MKTGKVVLVLGGRFAGRKAVIVKVSVMSFLKINFVEYILILLRILIWERELTAHPVWLHFGGMVVMFNLV